MGGFAIRPTGQQQMSQREVDGFLQEARMRATTKNPPILGFRMQRMIQEKNNGYPKHMYHDTLEMRVVTKEEEEAEARLYGYTDQYIPKVFPKWLYRRNMDPKFEPQFDRATGVQTNTAFVEERFVRNADEEKLLLAMKPKKGQSPWMEKVTDLPPIEDGPDEDPAVTIARLQGELSALRGDDSEKPRRGRPPKNRDEEPVEA